MKDCIYFSAAVQGTGRLSLISCCFELSTSVLGMTDTTAAETLSYVKARGNAEAVAQYWYQIIDSWQRYAETPVRGALLPDVRRYGADKKKNVFLHRFTNQFLPSGGSSQTLRKIVSAAISEVWQVEGAPDHMEPEHGSVYSWREYIASNRAGCTQIDLGCEWLDITEVDTPLLRGCK